MAHRVSGDGGAVTATGWIVCSSAVLKPNPQHREAAMSQPPESLVEYCFIITFSHRERDLMTFSGTYTPVLGMSRHDVFSTIRADHQRQLPSHFQSHCQVTFFSLERNELT
ncbi:hypothetical protein [Streptomyces sp. NPDC001970]